MTDPDETHDDPGVAVRRAWADIHAWVTRWAPADAPAFNPPVQETDIRAAQDKIGVTFPEELVASLSCHDGLLPNSTVMPVSSPLSAARIADHWQMCAEIAQWTSSLPPVPGANTSDSREPWWHPLWVPWAESDGYAQVIDLRPGPHQRRLGTAGNSWDGDFEDPVDTWPHLAAHLTAVARALREGGSVGGNNPYLTVDDRLWWDSEDARELNGKPLRPANGPS